MSGASGWWSFFVGVRVGFSLFEESVEAVVFDDVEAVSDHEPDEFAPVHLVPVGDVVDAFDEVVVDADVDVLGLFHAPLNQCYLHHNKYNAVKHYPLLQCASVSGPTFMCNIVQRADMDRSERLSTSVTPEQKTDIRIAAMRRDISESELLRQLVEEFLEEEDIPDEVRTYFKEENGEGNSNPLTATAD